jgi:hypothetical protein
MDETQDFSVNAVGRCRGNEEPAASSCWRANPLCELVDIGRGQFGSLNRLSCDRHLSKVRYISSA